MPDAGVESLSAISVVWVALHPPIPGHPHDDRVTAERAEVEVMAVDHHGGVWGERRAGEYLVGFDQKGGQDQRALLGLRRAPHRSSWRRPVCRSANSAANTFSNSRRAKASSDHSTGVAAGMPGVVPAANGLSLRVDEHAMQAASQQSARRASGLALALAVGGEGWGGGVGAAVGGPAASAWRPPSDCVEAIRGASAKAVVAVAGASVATCSPRSPAARRGPHEAARRGPHSQVVGAAAVVFAAMGEAGRGRGDVRGLPAGVGPLIRNSATAGCAGCCVPDSSAHAAPLFHPVTMAAPTPKATAKPPTRPRYASPGMPYVTPTLSRRGGNDRSP